MTNNWGKMRENWCTWLGPVQHRPIDAPLKRSNRLLVETTRVRGRPKQNMVRSGEKGYGTCSC